MNCIFSKVYATVIAKNWTIKNVGDYTNQFKKISFDLNNF